MQSKAVIGAMKIIYWLAKEEAAHTTKYESLLDLTVDLLCNYQEELNVAGSATYRSMQIVGEFLQSISRLIEEDALQQLASSTYSVLLNIYLHTMYMNPLTYQSLISSLFWLFVTFCLQVISPLPF